MLHTESLGGHSRTVVGTRGPVDRHAAAQGLALENTSLPQLVVAMSLHTSSARGSLHLAPSDDLEEVS